MTEESQPQKAPVEQQELLEEVSENEGADHRDEYFSVSPRSVAWVSAVFAIACLTTLAIVTSLAGSDALSTVALALAIIAFSIQIMVFIAQEKSASEQAKQSERLNAETRSLLTDIRATANSTAAMVGDQYRRVLEAALGGVAEASGAKSISQAESRLAENISRALSEIPTTESVRSPARAAAQDATPPSPPRPAQSPRRRPTRMSPEQIQRRLFARFPDDKNELEASATKLSQLSSDELGLLSELAEDEVESSGGGLWVGLLREGRRGDRLQSEGLVERFARRDEEGQVRMFERLTDEGRGVARLLTANGEIPQEVAEALETVARNEQIHEQQMENDPSSELNGQPDN